MTRSYQSPGYASSIPCLSLADFGSQVAAICLTIVDCFFVQLETGKHATTVPMTSVVPALKLSYGVRLIYSFALATTNLGICAFYLRVFPDHRSKWIVYALMGLIVCYTIPFIFIDIFQFHPISDSWSLPDNKKCLPDLPIVYSIGTSNVVADVLMLVFVVPRICKSWLCPPRAVSNINLTSTVSLQMARRQRSLSSQLFP
jgi:hypothetical protein